MAVLVYLLPWDFSPLFVVLWILVAVLYTRALLLDKAVASVKGVYWRAGCFYAGWLSVYIVWHTYFDYLSQYMFWVHRLQHLVLHHLAPLLMVLGVVELADKLAPSRSSIWLASPAFIKRPCELMYKFLQNAFIAPLLFVGLIYLWLWPGIHFSAMLNQNLYYLMNITMLLDGFLFWWLVLGAGWRGEERGFKVRIIMLAVVLVPQQLLGAYITLSSSIIYDVYDVCGRAWPISPSADQIYGGIVTWIPASMMSVLGFLLVLKRRFNYQQGLNV
ncbi:MAG: cytochrome c oxidase assembly protein [Cycloclasticus sp.]